MERRSTRVDPSGTRIHDERPKTWRSGGARGGTNVASPRRRRPRPLASGGVRQGHAVTADFGRSWRGGCPSCHWQLRPPPPCRRYNYSRSSRCPIVHSLPPSPTTNLLSVHVPSSPIPPYLDPLTPPPPRGHPPALPLRPCGSLLVGGQCWRGAPPRRWASVPLVPPPPSLLLPPPQPARRPLPTLAAAARVGSGGYCTSRG